jgi:hypothetical protein
LRAEGGLDALDEERLTYGWRHPDPRMDALQASLTALVEADATRHAHDSEDATDALEVFARVKQAALAAAGANLDDRPIEVLPQPSRFVPGLAESWFC